MANYAQGFLATQQAGIEARNDVTVAIRNWFANRNPLMTRLGYVPVERVDFVQYSHPFRARSTTLTATITTTTVTTLTLSDATFLMNHDVIQVLDSATGNYEFMQLNADPTSSTTITVTRNVLTDGRAADVNLSTGTNNSTVNLIGNSRTGAEIYQTGLTTLGTPVTQYCQTFQFPVQVGGSAQTSTAQVLPGGIQSPFNFNTTIQLQNMVDDMENTAYVGVAQAPNDSAGTTAKMNGLRNLLKTNWQGTPTNASAYGPEDLIRDTLQAARTSGGEPDLLIVNPAFMSFFAKWGQAVMRVPAGETTYGTPIVLLEAPFLHGVNIVEAPLFPVGSACALTSSEAFIRNKRSPFFQERGARGDMVEGDWLAELAITVINEGHHAWVENITAAAAA